MASNKTTTFLLLDVAGTPCALPRDAVREVLPLPILHAAPASDGPLAGFLNFGGAPVPVLDIAELLGTRCDRPAADPYRHLLLGADADLAFLVDRVTDVLAVSDERIGPVESERTLNGCVVAEIVLDGRLVHVLSLACLLTAEEQSRISAFRRRSADRLAALEPTLT